MSNGSSANNILVYLRLCLWMRDCRSYLCLSLPSCWEFCMRIVSVLVCCEVVLGFLPCCLRSVECRMLCWVIAYLLYVWCARGATLLCCNPLKITFIIFIFNSKWSLIGNFGKVPNKYPTLTQRIKKLVYEQCNVFAYEYCKCAHENTIYRCYSNVKNGKRWITTISALD